MLRVGRLKEQEEKENETEVGTHEEEEGEEWGTGIPGSDSDWL